MEEDPEVPIILGRQIFTRHTLILLEKETLPLRVDEVVLNIFQALKHLEDVSTCYRIDIIDTIVDE